MTDIEKAVSCLPGHTLALCKNGEVILSDKRGVVPMADFLQEGRVLKGRHLRGPCPNAVNGRQRAAGKARRQRKLGSAYTANNKP